MNKYIITLLLLTITLSALCAENFDPKVENQIDEIIAQMSLEEKAALLGGDTTGFDSKPLPRLNIPALRMTDGPNGVRWGSSTAFPVGVCIAATWDPDLVYQLAQAIARETKANGRNVLLGPCVNIHRDAHAGRNFESYGEDPYLAARIAVSYVQGMQSEKVMATTKHFAVNNQEFERNSMDSRVDERVLREIYFPAFKAAVQQGHTWAIMSSYNRVNGQYASSNTWLLNDVLKDEWGFQGFVMSDWGAVHSIVPTLYAGLDLEMPNGRYLNEKNVVQAIREGRMKESKVDDKIRRMLRSMFAMDLFENEIPAGGALHTDQNVSIAKKVAESGIVLLKNENELLPLSPANIKSIAVIGPNAATLRTGGGGSSRVDPIDPVSPLAALQALAPEMTISYSPGILVMDDLQPVPESCLTTINGSAGVQAQYFDNADFKGQPVKEEVLSNIDYEWGRGGPAGLATNQFSIRFTGKLTAPETARYYLGINSDDGSRVYLNDKLVVDNWGDHAMEIEAVPVELKAGEAVKIQVDFYEHGGEAGIQLLWQKANRSPLENAVALARDADVAVLFVGFNERDESEGRDRVSNAFPAEQQELIQRIAEVNHQVVVVFNSGAGVLMNDWEPKIPAILESWYPGELGGQAIAEILLGQVNPSGKLVTTFFNKERDTPTYTNYPGQDDRLNYAEGLFVGYRHYDKMNIEPLYAFGHGLSYTKFEYSDLKLSSRRVGPDQAVQVTLKLKNSGDRSGAEVVQLYLEDERSSVIRPVKELKAFKKVFLEAGEERLITLEIPPDAMKFWDIASHAWLAEPGKFTVHVGASSRDIRLKGRYSLKQ